MVNRSFQFILKRFNAGTVFSALCILFLPAIVLAQQDTISSISLSTPNPAPGSVLGVTVVYVQNQTNNNSFFLVALEPNGTTTLPGTCPDPGQIFFVDGANPAGPTSPGPPPVLTSTRDDGADPGPTQGWNAK